MKVSRNQRDMCTRIHIYVYRCFSVALLVLALGSFGEEASAAFGAGNAVCANFSNSSGSTQACTVGIQPIEAGNIAVLLFASDNFDTTNTTNNLLSSVSDTQGNTWTVRGCYTNGRG